MSCYHPLTGIRSLTPNPETGKFPVKVIKEEYKLEVAKEYGEAFIPIPCGKCIGCRLDYSRQWADRCMAEASYHKDNIFLTLTYDDLHLPPKRKDSPIHSLDKEAFTKFVKDLRSKLVYDYEKEYYRSHSKKEDDYDPPRFRIYGCGEYGSINNRPHYHFIIFGYCPQDLNFLKRKNGFDYYTSNIISDLWPNGFHSITSVSWDTCAYVARYVVKKQKGKGKEIYEKLNYEPEFVRMSRRPGIGKKFYEDHNDIVVKPIYMPTEKGKLTLRSNRYYDKLFDIEYPNDLEFIKKDRQKSALKNIALKSMQTSMNSTELRHSEETTKLSQIKALQRKEV